MTSANYHYWFTYGEFCIFCPFIRSDFPSIAYPCWDHSARTVLRNLVKKNIQLVSGVLPGTDDSIQQYQIASFYDLLKLKRAVPNCSIRYTDITPCIKQNCDATSRVLTKRTVEHLPKSILGSSATHFFLIAAISTHDGHPVVGPQKKTRTCARESCDEPSNLYAVYKKPDSFEEFLKIRSA